MRSTYDRSGGNEGADASHFLYQDADNFNVALDIEGPGVLYFARYNHWHGSPWHYEVDGTDHRVAESSTADPNHPVESSVFLPRELFPRPLAWTWSDTRGADLSWVAVPFQQSLRMAYSRTHYGTGYFIYHHYVPGTNLSRPLQTWNATDPPDADVLKLIARSGGDLVPRPDSPEGKQIGVREQDGKVALPAKGPVNLVRLAQGPAMLRALELDVPKASAIALSRARLRVTWDDRQQPSIDAPVALFYGAGTLYNRDGREYLVKAFPVNVRDDGQRVHLACYFPMPYFRSARIELVGSETEAIPEVRWRVRFAPYHDPANHVAYFHATYTDHVRPEPGKDLVLLDTRKVEESEQWSGHLAGTSFIFSHRANLTTLEGDPRFFFDDSLTPQAQGTGTEEWGGGGDYWGGQNMTLPFAGHPVGAVDSRSAKCEEDKIESAYRFLLADLMPFGKNARICLEHGGTNESTEHYEAVTYWYGAPYPTLRLTDELQIGDAKSEQAHQYDSPDASAPYEISSRYEWGVDHLRGKEVYSSHTDRGRSTSGSSEFTLKLEPENLGVLLRRKLDFAFPNQRGEVFVADASTGTEGRPSAWKPAGVWYLPGSSTCVYSNPKEELGVTQHVVQTSNRRFRDDEFLVPRALTAGRSAIRVRVRFMPVRRPLFPGHPLAELAWSEIRYTAYCFVMPAASIPAATSGSQSASDLPHTASVPIKTPLRALAANPNYFTDGTGKAIYLTGSHTWNSLQDWGTNGSIQPFDFAAYVKMLVKHNHNFTLLWSTELPTFHNLPTTASSPPDFSVTPHPWQRTGPGKASDGKLKFDLTKFNQAYFDRLRDRVRQLDQAGIYAGVYFFTGEWLLYFRFPGDGYPFTGTNNVNGIDDGGGMASVTMSTPNAITAIQDVYVKKVIDTLNDLPNVLWIVSEEAPAGSIWWNNHLIALARTYEIGKPLQHPIGYAAPTGVKDSVIINSDADWIAPAAKISPTTTCGNGHPTCKVNINDSDHSYFGMWNDSEQVNRNYFWINFTNGNQTLFMDPYVVFYPREKRNLCPTPVNGIGSGPDPRWDNVRKTMGRIRGYADRMNLAAMAPQGKLSSTGHVLASSRGAIPELLVYAPAGGSFTVDLSHSSGRFAVEWMNAATGVKSVVADVSGGETRTFTPPFAGGAVLYLRTKER